MSFRALFPGVNAIFKNRLSAKVFSRYASIKYASTDATEAGDSQPRKKTKKPAVPKITLISNDAVSITSLEEATKLSKRRDLKLVKIVDLDTKTQRPVYKLMTGAEFHVEDLKQREERKKERQTSTALKGEKVVILSSTISQHDLMTYVNKVIKWVTKRYEVRFVINSSSSNMDKAEQVYKFLEEKLKDDARILQKRIKGTDIKFQMVPPKKEKEQQDNS